MLTAADPTRYPPGVVAVGGPVDWYFHLPLWLQAPCCGETLWAYNAAHLDFLFENYVRATLREHSRGEHGWRNQPQLKSAARPDERRQELPRNPSGVARLREKVSRRRSPLAMIQATTRPACAPACVDGLVPDRDV